MCAFARDRFRWTREDVVEDVEGGGEGVVEGGEGSEGRLDVGLEEDWERGGGEGEEGIWGSASRAGEVDDGEEGQSEQGRQDVVRDLFAVAQVEDAQVAEGARDGVEGGGGGVEGSEVGGGAEEVDGELVGGGEGEDGEEAMGVGRVLVGGERAEGAGDVVEDVDEDNPGVHVELNVELTPSYLHGQRPDLVRIRRECEHTQSDKRRHNHHYPIIPTASFFFRCHVPPPLRPGQARLSLPAQRR